jgi:two-component system, OmpR family, phosphate regulon sensor histidine kinase PhoR
MRGPRSILFYAWLGLGVELLLVLGVIVFVLLGAAYQSSAITALHERVQRMQLINLTLQNDFLGTQRALRGYQATRQDRFLQTFYSGQDGFVVELALLRRLAWPAVLDGVTAQARAAQATFLPGDLAVTFPLSSKTARDLFERASASADVFIRQNARLQTRLSHESTSLATQAERTLGIGLGGTSVILAAGLMLPVIAAALALRWTSGPLHNVTTTVRRRSLGDQAARAVPGGPADVRDLAASLNFLADESDRLHDIESDRARLLEVVRESSIRIRQHLHAPDIIREAMTTLERNLAADFVWVGLTGDGGLSLAESYHAARDQVAGMMGELPADTLPWLRELFQQRSSYRITDLRSTEADEIPPDIRQVLLGTGAVSLLITPFGAGRELMGMLTLLRTDPGKLWVRPEIEAVESLAGDIGRGLEHARLYEKEERLVSELKSLDQAKSGFLASASHDLRTPLTSIIGYVEIMQDGEAGPVSQQQIKMLDAVNRNGRRLQNLIEDMLTISKIELGAFTSDLHPVDLAGLLPDAVDLVRPSAEEGGLTFEVAVLDRDLVVDGDAAQLDRVLMNLLSNAVKYTPSGGAVRLSATREAGEAVLLVSDTGIGIPEKDQKSLFTRFFRATNAVERAYSGSGLGLSIARSIIENHHGQIRLTSTEDAGTTVTVRLPLRGSPPEPAAAVRGGADRGTPSGAGPDPAALVSVRQRGGAS